LPAPENLITENVQLMFNRIVKYFLENRLIHLFDPLWQDCNYAFGIKSGYSRDPVPVDNREIAKTSRLSQLNGWVFTQRYSGSGNLPLNISIAWHSGRANHQEHIDVWNVIYLYHF
jgi:hypothetical protein